MARRAGQVRRWTPHEEDCLKAWWGKVAPWRIAELLKRTEKAVEERAYHLGIAQKPGGTFRG